MINNIEQEIINTYYNDYKFFFSKPNVEGIGLGYKYINKICSNELCIQVFVNKKVSINCLPTDGVIPLLYKGMKTDIIEVGAFIADDYCEILNSNRYLVDSKKNINEDPAFVTRVRPIQPGYCIGLAGVSLSKTGTFGYIVTDNNQVSKTYCILSNTITLADCNKIQPGANIIQPSAYFGGRSPQDVIAKLLRYSAIKFQDNIPDCLEHFNRVDAAIASYVNVGIVELINPRIPGIGVPRGITDTKILQSIQWTGCISGNQKGTIISNKGIIKVNYLHCGIAYFKDVTISAGESAIVADRGSLVCDLNKYAVGLMFGTNLKTSYNVMCSITNIQDVLDVTLLTLKG